MQPVGTYMVRTVSRHSHHHHIQAVAVPICGHYVRHSISLHPLRLIMSSPHGGHKIQAMSAKARMELPMLEELLAISQPLPAKMVCLMAIARVALTSFCASHKVLCGGGSPRLAAAS